MRVSLNEAGIDVVRLGRSLRNIPYFVSSFRSFNEQAERAGLRSAGLLESLPSLGDRGESAGSAGGHYFWQDMWVAQQIYIRAPVRHVDVGSRVDGFITHLLVFRKVEVVDIRPLESEVPGLTFIQDDGTELSKFADGEVESLSCLHALEHFGLGRYGDPTDPTAAERGMQALQRVLAPGGTLYFSVPSGRPRVEFNAHRVFASDEVLAGFKELKLVSFASVADDGTFSTERPPESLDESVYACGIYVFEKPAG